MAWIALPAASAAATGAATVVRLLLVGVGGIAIATLIIAGVLRLLDR